MRKTNENPQSIINICHECQVTEFVERCSIIMQKGEEKEANNLRDRWTSSTNPRIGMDLHDEEKVSNKFCANAL